MGKHRTTLQEEIIAEVTNRLNQLDVIPEVLMVRLPQPAFRRGGMRWLPQKSRTLPVRAARFWKAAVPRSSLNTAGNIP